MIAADAPGPQEAPARLAPRDRWLWHGAVLGGFLLLGILATWPLALHFTTAVIGIDFGTTRFTMADQDVILWTQWWVYDSVFHRGTSPFVSEWLYWPYYRDGLSTLLVDLQTWRAIITAPVQATLGLIAAYNAGVFLSFAVGGWGAWLLAREAGASRAAATLAGIVYVLGPYHLSQLHTEVAVVSTEALPFVVLWGWRAVRGGGWAACALAAASIVVANLLNWYYGAHGVLAVVVLAGIVAWGRRREGRRAILPVAGRALAVIALYALLFSPVIIPMLMQVQRAAAIRADLAGGSQGAQSGTYTSFNQIFATDIAIRAASLHPNQFVFPRKDARFTPPLWASTAYLGVTAMLLTLTALLLPRRRNEERGMRNEKPSDAQNLAPPDSFLIPHSSFLTTWGWAVFGAVYLILSLGPDLHDFNGQAVRTDLPLLQAIDRGPFVPLPYALLLHLPGTDLFRVPARAAVMVTLAVAVLAALGADRITAGGRTLLQRLKFPTNYALRITHYALVPVVAVGLMLGEYLTLPMPLYTPPAPAFYTQLGQEAGTYGILELPITVHATNDHRRMYNQTLHHKGISGGYLSRPIADPYRQPDSPFAQFTELYTTTEILEQDRDAATRALLALNDFRYLVAYKERRDYNTGTGSAAWDWPLGPPLYEDAQLRAYAVGEADLTRTWLYLGNSWSPGERGPDGAPRRWVRGGTGIVRVWSPGGAGRLGLTVESATGTRPVTVQLDEAALVGLSARPAPQEVQTPRLVLARGWYSLRVIDNGPSPGGRTLSVSHVHWTDEPP